MAVFTFASADCQLVEVYVEDFGVVGAESVSRRAESLGNGKFAVFYPALDFVRSQDFVKRVVNSAVLEISVFIEFFKCFIELFRERVLLILSVNEVVVKISF